jgi:hypothetical protein
MARLIPILLAVVGLGAGLGAGYLLRPQPEPAATDATSPCGEVAVPLADAPAPAAGVGEQGGGHGDDDAGGGTDFVKINNQFVIPVVHDADIAALVVMSLSLEVVSGQTELIYQREPKLRDVFLQVLFDHANAGGFDGAFTQGGRMDALRTALTETARNAVGPQVLDVLITDLARQDL